MAPEVVSFEHLKSLTQFAPPSDLEKAVRKRFTQPRRFVLPAAAALIIAAAALSYFASGHATNVAGAVSVPASSPIVSAAHLSSGQTTAFSITVRPGGGAHATPKAEAQPAFSSALVQAAGTTVFVGLKPGTTVTSVEIAANGTTYTGHVVQAKGGVDVMFPVNALPENWVMHAVVDGRTWIVRPAF